MRRSYLVLGQVLRREILQGLLAIEALPDEPAGEREAMVGIAPRGLEGRGGLCSERVPTLMEHQ
jgi:hypothetical protein